MNADIHSDKEDKGYKTHTNQRQRYTQFSSQKLFSSWIILQYTSIESHSNLIIGGYLANATLVYPYVSISYLIACSSLDESNIFVHLYWKGEKNNTKSYKAREDQHQQVRLWTKPMPSSICIDEEFILTIFRIINYHLTSVLTFMLRLAIASCICNFSLLLYSCCVCVCMCVFFLLLFSWKGSDWKE